MLRQAAAHIDTVRLGWGSAYVTDDLRRSSPPTAPTTCR